MDGSQDLAIIRDISLLKILCDGEMSAPCIMFLMAYFDSALICTTK